MVYWINTWKCVVYNKQYLEVCGVVDTIPGSVWCTGYNTWKCVVYWTQYLKRVDYWIQYLEACGVIDTIPGSVWCTGYNKR